MSKGWTEVLRKVWVSLLGLEAPRGFCIEGHALIPSLKGPTLWGTSGHRPQALVWSPCWQEGRVVRWQPATLLLRVLTTSPLPLALGLAPSLRDVHTEPRLPVGERAGREEHTAGVHLLGHPTCVVVPSSR